MVMVVDDDGGGKRLCWIRMIEDHCGDDDRSL